MSEEPEPTLGRRAFFRQALLAGGAAALPARPAAAEPTPAASAAADASVVYLSLSPDEASFVEALVNVMCPADALTPAGVDCGLATFIDRQLAGGFGKGERLYRSGPWRPAKPQLGYQLPLTPEEYFKAGVAAADAASRHRHNCAFAALPVPAANDFLTALAAGAIADEHLALADWFNELVYPLFVQACFADPVYGGNKDKVFWKMIGYPGLPAVHEQNLVRYRGRPFPGGAAPKSMEDFS